MPANMTHSKRLDEILVLLLSILMRYVNFSGICVCVVAGMLLLACVAAVQRRKYSQDQVTGMFVTLNATMIASRISAYVYNKAVLQVLFTAVLANCLRWLFPIDLVHQVEVSPSNCTAFLLTDYCQALVSSMPTQSLASCLL